MHKPAMKASPANNVAVNQNFPLAITAPEEGAGAAYEAMKSSLMEPLAIAHVDLPMDMAARVTTNGNAVADASGYVKAHPEVTYVKGPGITPRKEQVLATIGALEKNNRLVFTDKGINDQVKALREKLKPSTSPEGMVEFEKEVFALLKPIGSPNAAWRSELGANLSRGTSDALAQRSLVNPPKWNTSTPLTTYIFEATDENRKTGIVPQTGEVTVTFTGADGNTQTIGKQKLSAGTPIRIYATSKAEFNQWADGVLENIKASGAVFAHGMKQTVLKTYDEKQRGWLQDAVTRHGLADKIAPFARDGKNPEKLGNLLVDDLFSRLSTIELKEPMAVISPNHSYAAYVRDVWEGVKARGGFKPPVHSEVVRASATGDHYKAIEHDSIEYTAPKAGLLEIKDGSGKLLIAKQLHRGDLAMITHMDHERVKQMITQTLDNARASGRKNILFGFDDDGEYYSTAIAALNDIKGNYTDLNFKLMNAADATAEYLTGGVKDTVLMLNNIYGDFATDIEINGKGTSYSTGLIFDGRGVVELGSGGTAPDLVNLWKETGTLLFNPMSFVEGLALAMHFTAQNMDKQNAKSAQTLAVAEALETGMFAMTDKGIVVPIVKGKFKKDAPDYTVVSTQTFLQSVQVETVRALKKSQPALVEHIDLEKAEAKLARMMAVDKALFAAKEQFPDRWKKANITWNDAREKAGSVDPLNPDYSIPLPDGIDTAKLTPDVLLALQEARAGLAKSGGSSPAKNQLKNVFSTLCGAAAADPLVEQSLQLVQK